MQVLETVEDQNRQLKARFEEQGLRLAEVFAPTIGDAEVENKLLRELMGWVEAYRGCPDRRSLEAEGYLFPPIEPDCDPDTDWFRFERWMAGQPLQWSFVAEFGELKPLEELSHEGIGAELARLTDLLERRGVCLELQETVPTRVAYQWLCKELRQTQFEYLPRGAQIHLTGCTGYCPDCIQRPWCDVMDDTDPWDQ